MERIYIISRYRARTESGQRFNCQVAQYICRQVAAAGGVPVAPRLFYTQFLDDSYEDDRERGITFGLDDLSRSNEYLLIVIDGVISAGMKRELAEAARLNMRGHIISMTHEEIRRLMKVVR